MPQSAADLQTETTGARGQGVSLKADSSLYMASFQVPCWFSEMHVERRKPQVDLSRGHLLATLQMKLKDLDDEVKAACIVTSSW